MLLQKIKLEFCKEHSTFEIFGFIDLYLHDKGCEDIDFLIYIYKVNQC